MMTINLKFEEKLKTFSDRYFSKLPARLLSAINYSLFSGGKRVRPELCFLTAKFIDIPPENIIELAVAIEFIHTYSLIHDDMPCMDNDDFRRGQPTVHKAFGETTALLAGDALLNGAYEILFDKIYSDINFSKSCKLIANCAGSNGMILGQADEFYNEEHNEDSIIKIAMNKTGGLIYAAIMSIGILSYDSKKINALSTFARCLGLSFQIKDDLLDENKNEINSFISILGKNKTIELLNKTTQIAQRSLAFWTDNEAIDLLNFCSKLSLRTF